MYRVEHHNVCRNWNSTQPSPPSECAPPWTKGWGGTLACGYRGGGVPIPTTAWRKRLALCLLCDNNHRAGSPTICLRYSPRSDSLLAAGLLTGQVRCNQPVHCKYNVPEIGNKYSQKLNPIPTCIRLVGCSKIGGPIVRIYKSLADT
jgi:hypothetical protein